MTAVNSQQDSAGPAPDAVTAGPVTLADRFGIRTPQELKARAAELGGTEYIIEGLFPKQSLSLIVGDSGLGKSALLYQAALSVASGQPFLDKTIRQGRVLVMDGENGIGQVAVMVDRLSAHLGLDSPPDDLFLWNLNDAPPHGNTVE